MTEATPLLVFAFRINIKVKFLVAACNCFEL